MQQGPDIHFAAMQQGSTVSVQSREASGSLPALTGSSHVSAGNSEMSHAKASAFAAMSHAAASAVAAMSHNKASMALPLLTGSRPAVEADAAVRHGGIRSSTNSPLPHSLSRSASLSPNMGPGFATRCITASPVLGQIMQKAGLGESLQTGPIVAEHSKAPSVLGQNNVQAAVEHLLQRLPAESTVS